MFGCKGIVCILALQILFIFKLVPEVCHICQFWNCCQFSEYSVSKRLLRETGVRSMQNELHGSYTCVWYLGSKKRGKRCRSCMWQFWSFFRKKFALYLPINKTCAVMKRQQHQFPIVRNVLHAGFGNISSPHQAVRNRSFTFQMVMPSRYCIAPPGRCKECLKMRSYPNLKRLGSGIFFTVRMTSS